MATGLKENVEAVNSRIEAACRRAGRDPSEVKLVAVSKTHSIEIVRSAIGAGLTAFGENRVQEAEGKIMEIGRDEIEWHLIGHLQKNKARKAVQLFDVIQSLDSVELAERLERICIEDGRSELRVLVEVDLAGESAKTGITEDELPHLIHILEHCVALRFDGLMVLPPYFEDPDEARPFFEKLRELRDGIFKDGAFGGRNGELSMGMSHDFEVAIEEGATIIRVGTAIFGERTQGQAV